MGSFLVEDCFNIKGRGWVVSGKCLDGQIQSGDVVHPSDSEDQYTITGVERFVMEIGKPLTKGDVAGLLLREMTCKADVPPGTVLSHFDYVL